MISLVLQHLESLQFDLTAIDPGHRTDAADKVAEIASELRRAVTEPRHFESRPADHQADQRRQA